MKTGLLLIAMAFVLFTGCQKKSVSGNSVPENAVWRTPNGYVIPYAEHNNWEQYVSAALQEKVAKHYDSNKCTTPEIKCGLECIETREKGDCIKANACAPCMNCGCTTIVNPYDPS